MRNWIKALAVTSAIATGLVAAPALYAVESEGAEGQMMGTSMMGEGGMMGMMQQMSKMMEGRSEEHTSELQSLMRISYAVFCLKKKKKNNTHEHNARRHKV